MCVFFVAEGQEARDVRFKVQVHIAVSGNSSPLPQQVTCHSGALNANTALKARTGTSLKS